MRGGGGWGGGCVCVVCEGGVCGGVERVCLVCVLRG